METNHIVGRHVATGQNLLIEWDEGRIVRVEDAPESDSESAWLAPSLFDPQINGFAGVDFQSDQLTREDLRHAVRALAKAGCTRFLLTLITDEWSRMLERLGRLRKLRAEDPQLLSAIVGWHIEGPWLSDEPGFHGAHPPEVMFDPGAEHALAIHDIVRRDRVLLTVAPERPGVLSAIQAATELGMFVSLGHTNASKGRITEAQEAGASGFTHLGNACPQAIDRHDNIIWRVLDSSGLMVSLITDGIHVAPSLVRLVHRSLPPGRILHTTDAMAAAGAAPGKYTLGPLALEVGEDRVVRPPGRTNFAGSALTPIEAVRRSAGMLRTSWRQTWAASSTTPASWLRIPISLAEGNRADFCVMREGPDGTLADLRVFAGGKQVA